MDDCDPPRMILAYQPRRAGGWAPLVHVGLDRMQADSRISKKEDNRVLSGLGVYVGSNGRQALIEMDRAGFSQRARGDGRKRCGRGGGKMLSGEGRGRQKEG